MTETGFMNRSNFSKLVEDAVLKKRMTYIDAVIYVCEDNKIDPEDSKKFLSGPIKSKIEGEAIRLNLLPSQNCLEFE